MWDGSKAVQGEQVVFMGLDLSKPGTDLTAYWKYDGKTFERISEEEYHNYFNQQKQK